MEILNQGTISYSYEKAKSTMESISNVNSVQLILENDVEISKQALSTSYIPQGSVGYQLSIQNTGTNTLYNVTITDDLGGTNDLQYIDSSATLIKNEVLSSISPISSNPLTFNIGTIDSGETIFVTYMTQVLSSKETTSITNTATVTANGGEPSGTQVSSSSSATITLEEYAKLSISKTSSTETITIGNPFNYIFTITNSGNCNATNVVLTDELNENFSINSITVSGDTTTIYSPSEYTYENGTLTLPNDTGPVINVGAGETLVITINGTITQI